MSAELRPLEISGEDVLCKRLAPGHLNPDGSVISKAYKRSGQPDAEISVDLGRLTTPQGSLARAGRPGFRLGVLRVGDVRGLGLSVESQPEADNAAHCAIKGAVSRAICRRLAERTRICESIGQSR